MIGGQDSDLIESSPKMCSQTIQIRDLGLSGSTQLRRQAFVLGGLGRANLMSLFFFCAELFEEEIFGT